MPIILFAHSRWIFLAILLIGGHVFAQSTNNTWHHKTSSDTVFVFVHGILSNSEKCWRDEKTSKYWPDLVIEDARLLKPSIFLGGFGTDPNSGNYTIRNAADELRRGMTTTPVGGGEPPLKKQNILFVAHSTGGLVVRYMLETYQDDFKDKNIGLLLVASPSRGSAWANRLDWLTSLFGNAMAKQLEKDGWATDLWDPLESTCRHASLSIL